MSRVEPSPGSTERRSLCPRSPSRQPSLVWYLLACHSSPPSPHLHPPGHPISPPGPPPILCPPPQVCSPLSALSVSPQGLAPFSLLPSDQLTLQLICDPCDCVHLSLLPSPPPTPTDPFDLSPQLPVPREPSDLPTSAFLTSSVLPSH